MICANEFLMEAATGDVMCQFLMEAATDDYMRQFTMEAATDAMICVFWTSWKSSVAVTNG